MQSEVCAKKMIVEDWAITRGIRMEENRSKMTNIGSVYRVNPVYRVSRLGEGGRGLQRGGCLCCLRIRIKMSHKSS